MSFIICCQGLLTKAALQGCILSRTHTCLTCGIGRLVTEAPFPEDMGKRSHSPSDGGSSSETRRRHHKHKHSKSKRNKEEKSADREHKSRSDRASASKEVNSSTHKLQGVTQYSVLKSATSTSADPSADVSSLTQFVSVLHSEEKLAKCVGLEAEAAVVEKKSSRQRSPLPPSRAQFGQPCRTYSTHSRRTRRHEDQEDGDIEENDFKTEPVPDGMTERRRWEWTAEGRRLGANAWRHGLVFTTMTYNVLSQVLLERHRSLYLQSPPQSLDWNIRRQQLLNEILFHSPDILCMQEVEENHFNDFFKKELEARGYEGQYQKRTNDKTDGCAIFFKQSKFSLLEARPVAFNQGSLLNRDNVALILQLAPKTTLYKGTVPKVCVATTHLLFNPRRGDIKLGQLMVLLAELDRCSRLQDSSGGASNVQCPTILCGDFNLEPGSYLFNFLASGYLRYEGVPANVMSGQPDGLYASNRWPMARDFFPSHMPISSGCQYMHHLSENSGANRNEGNSNASSSSLSQASEGQNPPQGPNPAGAQTVPLTGSSSCPNFSSGSQESQNSQNWQLTPSQRQLLQHTGDVRHRFQFLSVYRGFVERLNGEPEVTTQHSAARCTVDYIFYTVLQRWTRQYQSRLEVGGIEEGHLKLLGRYGLMSSRELARMGNLPNRELPSDHLCLMAKFLLQ